MSTTTLLLIFATLGQSPIETKYSEAHDISSDVVDLKDIYTYGGDIDLSFWYDYKGKTREACNPLDKIDLMLFSSSKDWRFLKYNDTVLMIDGERRSLKSTRNSRDVETGYVTEIFHYDLRVRDVLAIAYANEVKLFVGSITIPIHQPERDDLKEYCRRLLMSSNEYKAIIEKNESNRKAMVEAEQKAKAESERAEFESQLAKAKAENDKLQARARDKAAQSDIQMAKQFIKIDKAKSAREYLYKALNRKPSESLVRDAEGLLEKLPAE